MSSRRTTPLILIFFWMFCVLQSMSVSAATITLSWTPNSEETLAGYRVHYGTQSRDYQSIDDVGNITRYVIDDLGEGETYFFAATAYDLYGNESTYSQEVSYTVPVAQTPDPEPTPDPIPAGSFTMETGEIDVDHNWTRIQLSRNFSDPIVIANILGFAGDHPSVVRVRNVDSSGFEIRVQEWDYLDGVHKSEQIGYLVLERGSHVLADGSTVLADSFTTSETTSLKPVRFGTELSSTPVVATSIVSVADGAAVTGRMDNVTSVGFEYMMQEEENADQIHQTETVMYIAWEESQGTCGDISFEVKNSYNLFGDGFQTQYMDTAFTVPPVLVADMQTCIGSNPATLRYTEKTNVSFELLVHEEQSKDSEMDHYGEYVGYMAFSAGSVSLESPDQGADENDEETPADPTNPDEGTSDPQTMNLELGEVSADHTWTSIRFAKTYTDPVVVASGVSFVGDHPSVIRIRNLSPQGCEIRVQEWDYLDGRHKVETLGYIVAERGTHVLQDGTMISAGSTDIQVSNEFISVAFDNSLSTVPVVLAGITSTNDEASAATRIQNISTTGFETSIQEQEKSDQQHAPETVSYIAWEPSSGIIDQKTFEVGTTGSTIDSTFSPFLFDSSFDQTPALVTTMQTARGDNPCTVRYDQLTPHQVEMMIEEEQSADHEMDHLHENVGYIAFDTN
ncbi:fibronectin type III domain-containing protein [Desulfoplanes sp. PS50]